MSTGFTQEANVKKITVYFHLDLIFSGQIEDVLFEECEANPGLFRNIVSH